MKPGGENVLNKTHVFCLHGAGSLPGRGNELKFSPNAARTPSLRRPTAGRDPVEILKNMFQKQNKTPTRVFVGQRAAAAPRKTSPRGFDTEVSFQAQTFPSTPRIALSGPQSPHLSNGLP